VLRGLAWLQAPLEIVKLGVFLVFVALGLFAWARGRRADPAAGRRAADRLILYALAVSLAVGLTQQESWPFSNWALVHGLAPRQMASWEMEAIDAAGRAWPVDPRVLQPLSPEEFGGWMSGHLGRLTPEGRRRVAQFLLERAEAGRARVKAGGTVGVSERWLGPLAAPYHFHGKAVWRGAADVPDQPFTALRIWSLAWDVEERAADPARVRRRLLLALPEGPEA
jgi:hypothetical protein